MKTILKTLFLDNLELDEAISAHYLFDRGMRHSSSFSSWGSGGMRGASCSSWSK